MRTIAVGLVVGLASVMLWVATFAPVAPGLAQGATETVEATVVPPETPDATETHVAASGATLVAASTACAVSVATVERARADAVIAYRAALAGWATAIAERDACERGYAVFLPVAVRCW